MWELKYLGAGGWPAKSTAGAQTVKFPSRSVQLSRLSIPFDQTNPDPFISKE
jgi:hypothetical protein